MIKNGPLHLAVLQDDFAAISLLKHNQDLVTRKNAQGLTPLELALLLGKHKAVSILSPCIYPPIMIQKKGEDDIGYYNRDEFEKFFGIKYLQTPFFNSYELLQEMQKACPWMLLHTVVGREHRSLGALLHKPLFSGRIAPVAIRWIDDEMGYGLFSQNLIAKEAFIGQYTGLVHKGGRFGKKMLNGYCIRIPTKFWSLQYFVMDAQNAGNELRFANHSDAPNIRPFCLIDRGLVHIGFFALRQIEVGEELTFDYGRAYWKYRKKK
ncbi:MAG: SET domain-containing protein-lysine N-methyltransferase [Chlamydiales bacterium]|nr:SET domain-containing protein-lysine N-methyltransferase [Chlamydiales bacterium]